MKKNKIGAFDAVSDTVACLGSQGALLIAAAEPVNPMTIGWGTIGIVWGKPVFAVLVRPSRFTHGLMEKAAAFSVNVPPQSLGDVCMFCGSKSGRDVDKIAETGITVQPGKSIDVPTIADCPIHYECRMLHRNQVDRTTLAEDVAASAYRSGDYHTIFWGEIVGVYKRA